MRNTHMKFLLAFLYAALLLAAVVLPVSAGFGPAQGGSSGSSSSGGVTSIAGTANQITASASTGAVTLSLASAAMPWTRTSTTIAPTTGTDTVTLGGGLGGTLTWASAFGGVNARATPNSYLTFYGDDGNLTNGSGLDLEGDGNLGAYMRIYSQVNSGGVDLFGGVSASGNGGVINFAPTTGLTGSGKSDGYVNLTGVYMPQANGVAALGSTSKGFSELHLSSAAVLSWNDDAGIARIATNVTAAGAAAGGNGGQFQAAQFASGVHASVSSSQTLDQTASIWPCAGNITLQLPTASGLKGVVYTIKMTDSGTTKTIHPTVGDTIDGSASGFTITTQYQSVDLFSDGGTNWYLK